MADVIPRPSRPPITREHRAALATDRHRREAAQDRALLEARVSRLECIVATLLGNSAEVGANLGQRPADTAVARLSPPAQGVGKDR